MEIYIQSAGVSQEQDYSWQKISANSQQPIDEPELVEAFKHLLDTQSYSILIGRKSSRLILLVTGMKSSQRKDYRGRTLRNSIAFITEENRVTEKTIRKIAVVALNDKLSTIIDEAIKSGGQYGFEVSSYEKVAALINESDSNMRDDPTEIKDCQIGENSPDNRKKIADTITKQCLPKNLENLVIVTGNKTEDSLKNAGVWRGLSNLIKSKSLDQYNREPENICEKVKEFLDKLRTREVGVAVASIAFIGLLLIFNPFKTVAPNALTPLAVISSNSQYIALADSNGKFQLKDNKNQLITQVTLNQDAPIKSVAISSNGQYVASGNAKGEVWLYRVNNGKLEKIDNIVQHTGEVLSVSIMVTGKPETKTINVVSGGSDGEVKLWTPGIK
jgi:hypothetical protein